METAITAILWLIFGVACLAVSCAAVFIGFVWYQLWKDISKK